MKLRLGVTDPYIRCWLARIIAHLSLLTRRPIACHFRRHGAGTLASLSSPILKVITHLYLRHALDPEIRGADVRNRRLGRHAGPGQFFFTLSFSDGIVDDETTNGPDDAPHDSKDDRQEDVLALTGHAIRLWLFRQICDLDGPTFL